MAERANTRPEPLLYSTLLQNPSNPKLLTPTLPAPPPQKNGIQFQGDRGNRGNKKSIGVFVLSGKIMILQGVGHPISCLGVCYANEPPKGGLYGVRA